MLSEENKDIYCKLKGYLDLEWRKKNQCLDWLNGIFNVKMSERSFRAFVSEFNKEFQNQESDMFIVHSNNGYYLTNDVELIKASTGDNKARAYTMLKEALATEKAIANRNQIKLMPDEAELYEIISRMQVDLVED